MQLPSQAFDGFLDQVGGAISVDQLTYLAPHFEESLFDLEQLTRPGRQWVRKCSTWAHRKISKVAGLEPLTSPWQVPQPLAPIVVHLGDPGVPSITPQEAELAAQWLKARWLNLQPARTKAYFPSHWISSIRADLEGRPPQSFELALHENLCRTSIPVGLVRQGSPVASTWMRLVPDSLNGLYVRAAQRPVNFSRKAVHHVPYVAESEVAPDVALDRFSNIHLLRTATNCVARLLTFERDPTPIPDSPQTEHHAPIPDDFPTEFTDSHRLIAFCEIVRKPDCPLDPNSYTSIYQSFVSNEFVRTANAESIVPLRELWVPNALAEQMQTPWLFHNNWIHALRRQSGECVDRWSDLARSFLYLSVALLDRKQLPVALPLGQVMRGDEPVWLYFGAGMSAAQIATIMSVAAELLQHVEIW